MLTLKNAQAIWFLWAWLRECQIGFSQQKALWVTVIGEFEENY